MADKKDKKESKVILERVYNVPLRKKYQRAPRWKRTNRAVKALREFVLKNMKAKEVKIGKYSNLELWKHGIKNPPHHIKVVCKKDEEGIVKVEIEGAPEEKIKEAPKKAAKKPKKEEEVEISVKDALGGEEDKLEKMEKKEEAVKEEKADEAKKIQKEEINEMKKEESALKHHALKQPKVPKRVEQHPTAPMQKG